MGLRHIKQLLRDSGGAVAKTHRDGPCGTRNHSEVLLVCLIDHLRGHLCARCLGEPLPSPGHLVAPLEARTMHDQVYSGHVLTLL